MEYKPNPIDTSTIELSSEILELSEILSRNMHDVWAKGRLDEGWRYGAKRDDDLKYHPNLVPFENLPETEMVHNRDSVLSTLKALVSLGYQIMSSGSSTTTRSHSPFLPRQRNTSSPTLPELEEVWLTRLGLGREQRVEFYRDAGERILRIGEPLLAFDIVARGLSFWPEDVRLRQLLALSLARTGATLTANNIAKELKEQGYTDGETMGLLGRTFKDLWLMIPKPRTNNTYLEMAAKHYSDAFQQAGKLGHLDDEFYLGINAATVFLLLGKKVEAEDMSRKVRDLCLKKLETGTDYWAMATLGEAAIILENLSEAEERYIMATEVAKGNLADLSTTKRQARLLLDHLNLDRRQLDHCFGIPKVVVFAGLMIDQPNRPAPRFPESLEKAVYREIVSQLQKMDAGISYSSAACGSDILFLEAMLERKGEITVVLPHEKEAFKRDCVDTVPGADWGERFEKVLKQAAHTITANDNSTMGSSVGYEYANLLQDGLAVLQGLLLETDVCALAVWDRRPGDGIGGTFSLVEHWQLTGRRPEIIDTNALLLKSGATASIAADNEERTRQYANAEPEYRFPQEIKAMIFCDVQGYSRLKEEKIPTFVEHFMGTVEGMLDGFPDKPLFRNTWGDELFCVFSDLRHAGHFALDLHDRINSISWEEKGLPKDLNMRISLHAGPVFSFKDPVLKVPNYTGSHVSRASRIEAVTPPGEIFASQQFAALSTSLGMSDFSFDYVGHVPLPKTSKTVPLYLVRRAN